jgi:hypothetical protein
MAAALSRIVSGQRGGIARPERSPSAATPGASICAEPTVQAHVALGLVLGLGSALAVSRVVARLLYGITPTDFPTFGVVTLVLVAVARTACAIPAVRASRTDPIVALR